MDRTSVYYQQVQLLVQLLPLIAKEDVFALKGGTAINLFVRDLPRLSVDIDLVFLPAANRNEALRGITEALDRLAGDISKLLPRAKITKSYQNKADALRLIVEDRGRVVKIELSPVLRGTVFSSGLRPVSAAVEEEFGFAEIPVVSFEDLYAGKICAALDRQHPRDLFDLMQLLEREGISEELKQAVIIYLLSHSRPPEELLNPNFKNLADIYQGEFQGMAVTEVSLEQLEQARAELVSQINQMLTEADKAFLIGFYSGEPDWALLGLANVDALPAIAWKLQNIAAMPESKRRIAVQNLKTVLDSTNQPKESQ